MDIETTLATLQENTSILAAAQVGHETRLARVEEGFRRLAEAHQALVQLLGIHDERLDAGDEARTHTDARLDGLIDAQIDFSERLAQLAAIQAEQKREAEARGARLDEKLAQLQEAQARAAEQIKLLIERNGSDKVS